MSSVALQGENMPKYCSTRNKNVSLSSSQAILRGLSDDGGLFTPTSLTPFLHLDSLVNASYQEIAQAVLDAFLTDYSSEQIQDCINKAYDNKFDTKDIVPLHKINEGYLAELWHGPTSAFKDVALTILPHLLTTAYKKENSSNLIYILTATSGDTGKAALSGFKNVPHTAITVFYPEIGASEIQKIQMQTSLGDNVQVVAVKGNFDDCQRLVKEAYSNPQVINASDKVSLSSANSINIGRLIPQVVYYVTTYLQLVNNKVININDPINFVVPTGNFGNILAGYLAKRSGLPINKLICASNTNNVLTDFINTGTYQTNRNFTPTMSPSMDILVSSNLERLLFLLSGNNDQLIKQCMDSLKQNGIYTIPQHLIETIQTIFKAYWCDEKHCQQTIRNLYDKQGYLIDTHTAVALNALHEYQNETNDTTVSIVLSTASPYKFSKDVYRCLTDITINDDFEAMAKLQQLTKMPVPNNLANLKDLPIRFNESININDGISVILKRIEELNHD